METNIIKENNSLVESNYKYLNEIKLLTRKQLAAAWSISESRLDLINEDELPRIRIGKSIRFSYENIQNYIKNH